LTAPPPATTGLARKPQYGIFPSQVHPKTLSAEGLRIIRRYCGNDGINIGVQSGSKAVLRAMKRPAIPKAQIEESVALVQEFGFEPRLDFIIGFPGETEEDRIETLQWIRKLHEKFGVQVWMFYFAPLAGTPLFHKTPTVPGTRSAELLRQLCAEDICNMWWQTHGSTSWKVVRAVRQLDPLFSGKASEEGIPATT